MAHGLGTGGARLFTGDKGDPPGGLKCAHQLSEGLGTGGPARATPTLRSGVEADRAVEAELLCGAPKREPGGQGRRISGLNPNGVDKPSSSNQLRKLRVVFGDLGDHDLIVGDQLQIDRLGETDLVGERAELSLVVH